MKQTPLLTIGLAVLGLWTPSASFAQPDNSMLYQPNVDLTTMSQNTFVGTVGGIFYTPYFHNVTINWLGYADPTGAPLVDSHLVTIWDNNPVNGVYSNIIASATVPAGTAAPLYNGYRWVQIAPVTLNFQSYYVIGAQTDGVDLWGDLISNTDTSSSPDAGNNGQITWNVVNGSWSGDPYSPMVQASPAGNNLYGSTRAGRYDYSPNYPMEPPNQVGSDSIYPAPNMGYNLPIPEPTSLGLLGLGATVCLLLRRGRKG